MTNTTSEDNSPDPIEQLYIESSAIGLIEFRKRIHALNIEERIYEVDDCLVRARAYSSRMLEQTLENRKDELTDLKDKQELIR